MLNPEGQIDRGDLHAKDILVDGIRATGCGLSVHDHKRSTFDSCTFLNVTAMKCVMGYPIFRRCTIGGIKSDFLSCHGALFLECKLQGIIDGVTFALLPAGDPSLRESDRKRIAEENLNLSSKARFCLDVRDAILANVGFYDAAIAPKILFKPGQCLIYRAKDLVPKLATAFKSINDKGLHRALVGPPGRKDTVHLTSLEGGGLTERIDEIKSILTPLGIEVLEEPLC